MTAAYMPASQRTNYGALGTILTSDILERNARLPMEENSGWRELPNVRKPLNV